MKQWILLVEHQQAASVLFLFYRILDYFLTHCSDIYRLSLRFVEYQYLSIIPHADTSAFNQIHGGFVSNTSQEVQGLLAEERKRTQATEGALHI